MEFGLSTEQTQLKDALDHYLRERAPLDRVRRFADNNEGRAADLIAGLAELEIFRHVSLAIEGVDLNPRIGEAAGVVGANYRRDCEALVLL